MIKRPNFILFDCERVRLDSIVDYFETYEADSSRDDDKYGICFILRDGTMRTLDSNYEPNRNNLLDYLDEYFNVKKFPTSRCSRCKHYDEECEDCDAWSEWPKFEKEEKHN